MCIEDYRLGRATYSHLKSVNVDISGQELLPASYKRVSVVFASANASGYYLSNGSCGNDSCSFYIPANSPPFKLNIQEYGDIVRKAWFAVSAGSSINVGVIETYLDLE
jgi:hypothetical protein